jgi:mRNA-degrading endonuclease YafQ of YafQ-DinJ toxin-antitoxin module
MSSLKDKLEEVIEEIRIDEIQKVLEKALEEKEEEQIKKRTAKGKLRTIADNFLEETGFNRKLRAHPLIGKAINMGNLTQSIRRSEYYKKLNEKLSDISKRGARLEDLKEIKSLVDCLRNKAVEYVVEVEVSRAEQGLRHIHAPGSVAKSEGRNLYLPGEEYSRRLLNKLASRICSSIALGDSLGIFSENDKLMLDLKQLALQGFGSRFRIEPRELKISRDEENRPYAALLAFLLWLVEELLSTDKAEIKALIESILNNLRVSTISLFFMPPEEEKWSTISLPRLDIFIDRWILSEESRAKIKALRDTLNNFIAAARRAAKREGKVREVENTIDLLMNNYEAFCRSLIEHGILDFYAMRRLMDVIIDVATKYDLRAYLRPLGSVVGP